MKSIWQNILFLYTFMSMSRRLWTNFLTNLIGTCLGIFIPFSNVSLRRIFFKCFVVDLPDQNKIDQISQHNLFSSLCLQFLCDNLTDLALSTVKHCNKLSFFSNYNLIQFTFLYLFLINGVLFLLCSLTQQAFLCAIILPVDGAERAPKYECRTSQGWGLPPGAWDGGHGQA